MRCRSCESDNPEGVKFCGECGASLQNRCPQCGAEHPPRFKFCGQCGASHTTFTGDWALKAAQAVCAGEEIEASELLDLLTALVEKSLVNYEEREGEARYRLLETVRQYGRDRLLEAGEAETVRRRHQGWYLGFAEQAEPELRGPEQMLWLERLESEHDNLRAALEWCQSDEESGESGLRLAGALGSFWGLHSYLGEGRAWIEEALARTARWGRTAARAKALYHAGTLAWLQGDWVAARPVLEESVAICRELGNQEQVAHSLGSLSIVVHWLGDPAAARALLDESVALFRQGRDTWGLAVALITLATRQSQSGNDAAARALYEESLALFRKTGDLWGIGLSLVGLGSLAYRQGDYAAARRFFEEGLASRRKLAMTWAVAVQLINLGNVSRFEGDDEGAAALYKESLALSRDLGSKRVIPHALYNLGYVARHQGEDERAARLFGAAQALLDAMSTYLDADDRAEAERNMAVVRAALGEAAFAAAWAAGRAMPLDEAIALALEERDGATLA